MKNIDIHIKKVDNHIVKAGDIEYNTGEIYQIVKSTEYGATTSYTKKPEDILWAMHEALGSPKHMFFVDRKLGNGWARELSEIVYPERLIDGRWVDCVDATIEWKDATDRHNPYERVTLCLSDWDLLYSDTPSSHKEWLESWDEGIFYYLNAEELKSIKEEDSHDEWSIVDW